MARRYVPSRGDVVWLSFSPQAGHEQAGRRPALVISPAPYNGKVGLALLCPITSQVKGYPFEVLAREWVREKLRKSSFRRPPNKPLQPTARKTRRG